MRESLHDLFAMLISKYDAVYNQFMSTRSDSRKNSQSQLSDEEINKIKEKVEEFRDYISSQTVQTLSALTNLNPTDYLIHAGLGNGNMTGVPYIMVCNVHITRTPQKGVYIVYLLNKDTKSLYLTLGQAGTEIEKIIRDEQKKLGKGYKKKLAYERLLTICKSIRDQMGDVGLDFDGDIHSNNEFYDAGTIYYKKYTLENLPDEETLKNDLLQFIAIYEVYYNTIFRPANPKAPELSHETTVKPQEKENPKDTVKPFPFTLSTLDPIFTTPYALRFITSLLAKPFVILSGNSGTGKTRIAKEFAEYLQVTDEAGRKNWELVPVGADWTDNTEVLGYYDPLGGDDGKGTYRASRILQLLVRANAHPTVPYFLILDEMNLSHVERYFSDFLSHMETEGNPFVLEGFGKEVLYPQNLFVVGTVNMDETTYMFSPKVLDRANVIEFKPAEEDVLGLFKEGPKQKPVDKAPRGLAEGFLQLALTVRQDELVEGLDYDRIQAVFRDVYEITDRAGFAFAFRTVKEICRYVAASYALSEMPLEKFNEGKLMTVVDEQLFQKVLPKVYGNKKEIGGLIRDLQDLCGREELPLSRQKLASMKGKLDAVQFASFM